MDPEFMEAMANARRENRRVARRQYRRARRWHYQAAARRRRLRRKRRWRLHMQRFRPIYLFLFAFEAASVTTIWWVLHSAIG